MVSDSISFTSYRQTRDRQIPILIARRLAGHQSLEVNTEAGVIFPSVADDTDGVPQLAQSAALLAEITPKDRPPRPSPTARLTYPDR